MELMELHKKNLAGQPSNDNDHCITKSKRGPRRYSRQDKINARKEWDEFDRDKNPETLEEWLENKFGSRADGLLIVPPSTFYGWPKS